MQFSKYTNVSSGHMGLSSLYFTLIKMSHGHKSRNGRTISRTVDTETKHLSYSYRWMYIELQREENLNDSRDMICKYWNFCLTETVVSVVTDERERDR
jgi:hypothetical protein